MNSSYCVVRLNILVGVNSKFIWPLFWALDVYVGVEEEVWFRWETVSQLPQFLQVLQCWVVAQKLYLASSPVSFSLLLIIVKCQKLLTMAERTVEVGGHRVSNEVSAVSSCMQSQLSPQGGVIKMDCKRYVCLCVCYTQMHAIFPPLFARCIYTLYVG